MTDRFGLDRTGTRLLATALLLALGAYAITAGFDFVYDDHRMIVENDVIHSLSNWREIISVTWWPNALYRPVTLISFALDWAASGGNPHYFHTVNIVLHVFVTLLVFLLARKYMSELAAGIAAMLFAVHPVHVEAVASVVGRAEVLATLFALGAVLMYRKDGELQDLSAGDRRRAFLAPGALLLLLAAIGAKESAFATVGIFLIVDWIRGRRSSSQDGAAAIRRHAVVWVGGLLITFTWMAVRASVIGSFAGDGAGPGLKGHDLAGRILIMAPVALQYLRLLFAPIHLSADYSPEYLPAEAQVTLAGLLGFLVVLGGVAAGYSCRKKYPTFTFALMWIGGTLLIVSNILVPSGVMLAERSMYLPSVGAVMLLGLVVDSALPRVSYRNGVIVVASLVSLGFMRTLVRTGVWRDAKSFFPKLVVDAPRSFRSLWTGGILWYEAGDRKRGEELIKMALYTYPLHANTWQDLAAKLEEEKRWEEAARYYSVAFRIDSMRLDDAQHAVADYIRAGMLDSARAVTGRAQRVDPQHFRVKLALADIAIAEHDPLRAMTLRRQIAWQYPDKWQYWYITLWAALMAEYCPEVARSFAKLDTLHPDIPERATLEERAQKLGCRR